MYDTDKMFFIKIYRSLDKIENGYLISKYFLNHFIFKQIIFKIKFVD